MSKSSQSNSGSAMRARRVPRLPFNTTGPSKTKQSMAPECDINNIMRRFEKTGILEHVSRHAGRYGDFTGAPASYHEALNQVVDAQTMFLALPAKVRARFSNDPGEFLAFVSDPANVDELIRLGLANPRPADPAQPAPSGAPGGPQGAPDAGGAGGSGGTNGGASKAS